MITMTTQEQVQKLKSDIRKHSVRDVLFASSEVFIIFVLVTSGFEFIYIRKQLGHVSQIVYDINRLSFNMRGTLLLALSFIHAVALLIRAWKVRVAVMFGEVIYFMSTWYALIISDTHFVGVFMLPTFAAFCMLNLLNCVRWERHES